MKPEDGVTPGPLGVSLFEALCGDGPGTYTREGCELG